MSMATIDFGVGILDRRIRTIGLLFHSKRGKRKNSVVYRKTEPIAIACLLLCQA